MDPTDMRQLLCILFQKYESSTCLGLFLKANKPSLIHIIITVRCKHEGIDSSFYISFHYFAVSTIPLYLLISFNEVLCDNNHERQMN